MRALQAAKFLDFFSALMIIFQIILIGFAIHANNQTYKAWEVRFRSIRLAEELRHSSRDLTTAARAYVATGDIRYWQEFQSILDIRNGVKPRADGRTVPLRTLMNEASFKTDEILLLDFAEKQSNELARFETEAMMMVRELPNPSALNEKKNKAISKLYDLSYRRSIQEIMAPILRFEDSVNQRTLLDVEKYNFLSKTLLIVIAGLLLINALLTYVSSLLKAKDAKVEV